MEPSSDLIIYGKTTDGNVFRPSDWSERLCGVMSAFGPAQRLEYSPLVQPKMLEGVRSVIVGRKLAELDPRLFRFFVNFAQDNELMTSWEQGALDHYA